MKKLILGAALLTTLTGFAQTEVLTEELPVTYEIQRAKINKNQCLDSIKTNSWEKGTWGDEEPQTNHSANCFIDVDLIGEGTIIGVSLYKGEKTSLKVDDKCTVTIIDEQRQIARSWYGQGILNYPVDDSKHHERGIYLNASGSFETPLTEKEAKACLAKALLKMQDHREYLVLKMGQKEDNKLGETKTEQNDIINEYLNGLEFEEGNSSGDDLDSSVSNK